MANVKMNCGRDTLVKVIANSNHSNYRIGEIYRIIGSDRYAFTCESLDGAWQGNCLKKTDCVVLGMTFHHYEAELVKLKAKFDEIQSIMDWMRETGAVEYDEIEHKVWSVMNAVENDSLSKLDKMKLIASLIKK